MWNVMQKWVYGVLLWLMCIMAVYGVPPPVMDQNGNTEQREAPKENTLPPNVIADISEYLNGRDFGNWMSVCHCIHNVCQPDTEVPQLLLNMNEEYRERWKKECSKQYLMTARDRLGQSPKIQTNQAEALWFRKAELDEQKILNPFRWIAELVRTIVDIESKIFKGLGLFALSERVTLLFAGGPYALEKQWDDLQTGITFSATHVPEFFHLDTYKRLNFHAYENFMDIRRKEWEQMNKQRRDSNLHGPDSSSSTIPNPITHHENMDSILVAILGERMHSPADVVAEHVQPASPATDTNHVVEPESTDGQNAATSLPTLDEYLKSQRINWNENLQWWRFIFNIAEKPVMGAGRVQICNTVLTKLRNLFDNDGLFRRSFFENRKFAQFVIDSALYDIFGGIPLKIILQRLARLLELSNELKGYSESTRQASLIVNQKAELLIAYLKPPEYPFAQERPEYRDPMDTSGVSTVLLFFPDQSLVNPLLAQIDEANRPVTRRRYLNVAGYGQYPIESSFESLLLRNSRFNRLLDGDLFIREFDNPRIQLRWLLANGFFRRRIGENWYLHGRPVMFILIGLLTAFPSINHELGKNDRLSLQNVVGASISGLLIIGVLLMATLLSDLALFMEIPRGQQWQNYVRSRYEGFPLVEDFYMPLEDLDDGDE